MSGKPTGAVPFITSSPDGSFQVHEAGAALLSRLTGKIAVVIVAGRYRSGKSFLMSQLCGSSAFSVGHSVESHTRGIWIHASGVKGRTASGEEVDVVFMDSEGLASTDKTAQHDATLFSLSALLCSTLIYNSTGAIDEDSIASLGFIANFTKHIRVRAGGGSSASGGEDDTSLDEWAAFMPSFAWVLRDFALALVDEYGSPMTSDEYLESALADQPGFDKETTARNHVRKCVRSYFAARACYTLPRPVDDEDALQGLGSLAPSSRTLRREFREALAALRSAVLDGARAKEINGRTVTGIMLVGLARSYVSAINDGGVPSIGDAWESAAAGECTRLAEDVGARFKAAVERTGAPSSRDASAPLPGVAPLPTLPVDDDVLMKAHTAAAVVALSMYDAGIVKGAASHAARARAGLQALIDASLAARRTANANASAAACRALVRELSGELLVPAAEALRAEASAVHSASAAIADDAATLEADIAALAGQAEDENDEARVTVSSPGTIESVDALATRASAVPSLSLSSAVSGIWTAWAHLCEAYEERAVGPSLGTAFLSDGMEALHAIVEETGELAEAAASARLFALSSVDTLTRMWAREVAAHAEARGESLAQAQAAMASMAGPLAEATASLAAVQEEAASAREEVAEVLKRAEAAEEKLEKAKAAATADGNSRTAMQKLLKTREGEVETLRDTLAEREEELQALQSALQVGADAAANADASVAGLRRELAAARAAVVAAGEETARANKEADTARREAQTVRIEAERASVREESAIADAARARAAADRAREEHAALAARAVSDAESKLASAKKQHKKEDSALENEIAALRAAAEAAKVEHDAAEARAEEVEAQLTRLASALAEAQDRAVRDEETIAEVQAAAAAHEALSATLQEQLIAAHEELEQKAAAAPSPAPAPPPSARASELASAREKSLAARVESLTIDLQASEAICGEFESDLNAERVAHEATRAAAAAAATAAAAALARANAASADKSGKAAAATAAVGKGAAASATPPSTAPASSEVPLGTRLREATLALEAALTDKAALEAALEEMSAAAASHTWQKDVAAKAAAVATAVGLGRGGKSGAAAAASGGANNAATPALTFRSAIAVHETARATLERECVALEDALEAAQADLKAARAREETAVADVADSRRKETASSEAAAAAARTSAASLALANAELASSRAELQKLETALKTGQASKATAALSAVDDVREGLSALGASAAEAIAAKESTIAALQREVASIRFTLRRRQEVDVALQAVHHGAEMTKFKSEKRGKGTDASPRFLCIVPVAAVTRVPPSDEAAGARAASDLGEVLAWAQLGKPDFSKGVRIRDILSVVLGTSSSTFTRYSDDKQGGALKPERCFSVLLRPGTVFLEKSGGGSVFSLFKGSRAPTPKTTAGASAALAAKASVTLDFEAASAAEATTWVYALRCLAQRATSSARGPPRAAHLGGLYSISRLRVKMERVGLKVAALAKKAGRSVEDYIADLVDDARHELRGDQSEDDEYAVSRPKSSRAAAAVVPASATKSPSRGAGAAAVASSASKKPVAKKGGLDDDDDDDGPMLPLSGKSGGGAAAAGKSTPSAAGTGLKRQASSLSKGGAKAVKESDDDDDDAPLVARATVKAGGSTPKAAVPATAASKTAALQQAAASAASSSSTGGGLKNAKADLFAGRHNDKEYVSPGTFAKERGTGGGTTVAASAKMVGGVVAGGVAAAVGSTKNVAPPLPTRAAAAAAEEDSDAEDDEDDDGPVLPTSKTVAAGGARPPLASLTRTASARGAAEGSSTPSGSSIRASAAAPAMALNSAAGSRRAQPVEQVLEAEGSDDDGPAMPRAPGKAPPSTAFPPPPARKAAPPPPPPDSDDDSDGTADALDPFAARARSGSQGGSSVGSVRSIKGSAAAEPPPPARRGGAGAIPPSASGGTGLGAMRGAAATAASAAKKKPAKDLLDDDEDEDDEEGGNALPVVPSRRGAPGSSSSSIKDTPGARSPLASPSIVIDAPVKRAAPVTKAAAATSSGGGLGSLFGLRKSTAPVASAAEKAAEEKRKAAIEATRSISTDLSAPSRGGGAKKVDSDEDEESDEDDAAAARRTARAAGAKPVDERAALFSKPASKAGVTAASTPKAGAAAAAATPTSVAGRDKKAAAAASSSSARDLDLPTPPPKGTDSKTANLFASKSGAAAAAKAAAAAAAAAPPARAKGSSRAPPPPAEDEEEEDDEPFGGR